MAKPGLGTEVVLMDEGAMAAQMGRETPHITSLNVTKSSRVHVGPKFVSVNQTIQNKEMIKGRFLGLELMSGESTRKLRCSVAVFLCWAFLVSSGLAIYLVYVALWHQVRLDIGLKEPWYLRREQWQSIKKGNSDEYLALPVKYVYIGHSAGAYCDKRYSCIKSVRQIQDDHLKLNWDDIGPNFLVGGKGLIFEGRGANVLGAMVAKWNKKGVSVMFLGDYRTDESDPLQFEHINVLLKRLLELKVLAPDYTVVGYCQIVTFTISPGPNVMSHLNNITNWDPVNQDKCLR
ncbi:peptidoglycan-recognition protein SC2-like isoform X2 [Ostrinia furnacalis]|uniref:peptidoglycan-recognition protein SC2-like isoform X2 n=1 Tax=Ostrinia furnacalis TaxID=93504 RepID=UPI00103BFEDB|nr:peptidoglycan-recognition protein SC2-like isoform X2 [Ostrinia furnacalis]